ncbi:DUF4442 domain-containing protein [Chitinophaga agrisoli]|nr:DUF4442 domain-containing protein [Chitinophaga agrisoli]
MAFIDKVRKPVQFSLFLLWKLPSAWLSGVRVTQIQPDSCTTVVPFRWLSQNPFRSTYFACLAMAAEMSSGLLAIAQVEDVAPVRVSMLVTGMQASFMKKAKEKTWFTCRDGAAIQAAIAHTVATGEPVTITVQSNGESKDGTLIASFAITWSFKRAGENQK